MALYRRNPNPNPNPTPNPNAGVSKSSKTMDLYRRNPNPNPNLNPNAGARLLVRGTELCGAVFWRKNLIDSTPTQEWGRAVR